MKPRLLLITLTSPSTPLLKYVKANCSVKPSIRMKPNPMHRGLVPEKGESDLLPNELKVAWSRKAAMKGDVRSWFTKTNLHGLLFYFKPPSAIQRGFGRHNGKKKLFVVKEVKNSTGCQHSWPLSQPQDLITQYLPWPIPNPKRPGNGWWQNGGVFPKSTEFDKIISISSFLKIVPFFFASIFMASFGEMWGFGAAIVRWWCCSLLPKTHRNATKLPRLWWSSAFSTDGMYRISLLTKVLLPAKQN